MIAQGSDVNAIDQEGASALNRAVGAQDEDITKILLEHGADVEGGD